MIEKTVTRGPHVIAVEERRHKTTRAQLPAQQFLCHRQPAVHAHETYRCPHGERTWCVGAILPSKAEIEETIQARFGCACVVDSTPAENVLHSP